MKSFILFFMVLFACFSYVYHVGNQIIEQRNLHFDKTMEQLKDV